VVKDHLLDVVDRDGQPDLVHRSGNCTGYFEHDDRPDEPYLSASGTVLSINPRSMTLQLTTFMGYFMAHLMMLDKITDIPLYELDAMGLPAKSNRTFALAVFALALHNMSPIADYVPAKVFSQCGVDFNRWYPLPRRTLSTARFLLSHRRDRERHGRTLDNVRELFDVRCGPLNRTALVGVEPAQ
jgi:hypothetical protein